MKNITCQHCGTTQSRRRRHCISCGEELNFTEAEHSEFVDRMLYFRSSPFTMAVSLASYITAPIILVLFAVMCAKETHEAGVLLFSLILSAIAVVYSRFPIFSYRYLVGGRYRRRPDDFDDPYPESLKGVYIVALIFLVIAIVATAAYFYNLDEFVIRPPLRPDQLTPDMFEREVRTSNGGVYRVR